MKSDNNVLNLNKPANLIIPTILILIMISTHYFGSFLIFHTFAEFFSVLISFIIAFVTYFTYSLTKNKYLLFLGLGYFWIAILDILHIQTYPGMNIYDVKGMDPTLTLWIFARFLEAMIFLVAPIMRNRDFSISKTMLIFATYTFFVTLFAMSSFPLMLFNEESGLSLLKIMSEYGIILILLGALKLNHIKKNEFQSATYRAVQLAIIFTIISETLFTLYTDMYGFTNLLGHIFKFLSFWVLLVSLIKTSLQEPLKLMAKEASSYNAIPVPAVVVSNDGIIRQTNKASEKYLGLESSQILGKSNHELFHPSDLTVLECPVCQALKNNQVIQKLELTDSIGDWVAQYSLSFIEAESQQGAIQTCVDVTKIHKTNEEIQKLKERMELALLGNNDGIWDWDIIEDRVHFSSRWKEILGYGDDELSDLYSEWHDRVHPDDIENADLAMQETIDKHKPYYENTHRLRHKDGHWVWILSRAKTQYDEHGNAIRMIGTHTDISEEKALQLKYAQQAQIIEQIHDCVISTDLEGMITSWNHGAEYLLEYKEEEAIGQHITMLYLEEDFESLGKNIQTLMKKGEYHATVRLVKKSKDIMDADLSLSLLRDEKDEPIRMIGFSQDITQRKRAEDELKEQHKYLQSILDGIHDPIMVIKEDYTVEIMNSMLYEKMQHTEVADPEHPKCYEISHHRSTPCDGMDHPCPLKSVMETQKHTTVIHEHYNLNGTMSYVELSATPLLDKEQNCIGIIESSRDITAHLEVQNELREQKVTLDHQAHHDALTGLPNRILFNDRLEQGIEKAKRNNTTLALFFIDLDHFKEINDSLGHAIGDEILKSVTQRLNQTMRKEDALARLGGDEFTVIMEGLTQAQDATLLAEKILKVLAEPITIEENVLYVSSSIGISFYPEDGDSAHDLLKYADVAMYKAKDEGRNNFQLYSSEMTKLVFERMVMEASLREALKNEEFVIHYQPQVNGETDKLIGMEGLVRWKHPNMGLVTPDKFIPLLEKTGLIIQLDQWVMKTAMMQMVQWHKQGYNPGILALNLAIKQLKQKDLVTTIKTMMKETGCKPEWFSLEVTEGQIMNDPDKAIITLNQISDIGIELAVDDFGTGYSSLSYLKRLPIDKLKIDQSFVEGLPNDEEDAAITRSIIALSQSLNLKVIAEGVETKAQKDFLVENGCKHIQGYFYSKPMQAVEIESIFLKG